MATVNNKKAYDAMIRARTQIIVREPFFGTLALQLRLVETDRVPTAGVDGVHLYYNAKFILSLTEEELIGVVGHEVFHCVFQHFSRRGHRDHMKFNIAGDFAINRDLKKVPFQLPWKPITLKELMAGAQGHMFDPQFDLMSTEEIYERIPDPPGGGSGGGQGNDPGGCGGVMDAGSGPGDPDNDTQGAGKLTPEQVAHDWQANVRMAVAVARANNAGQTPGYLERLVTQLKRPKVSWRDLTHQFIDQSLTTDYSYRRPNRRYVHAGLILPGNVPDALHEMVFFVDCSGSISQEMFVSYASEVASALDTGTCDHLYVVYADDGVRHVDEFLPGDVFTCKTLGHGGTNFNGSFEWLAKNAPDAACAIYLTDMETCSFGKEPNTPVMWAAYNTEERLSHITPPFGQVIHVGFTPLRRKIMATVYLVTLHVGEKELPIVLGAIAGSAKLVSVTPTAEEPKAEPFTKNVHYVDGKRDKGISGEELVLSILSKAGRPVTNAELEAEFEEKRFSRNSVSPNVHRLLAAEKIRRVGTGSYCLPGTLIKMGADAGRK